MLTKYVCIALFIAGASVFGFAHNVHASTLYWYSTGDTDWTNVTNWWTNSAHTIAASDIPQSGDNAILIGSTAPVADLDDENWVEPNSINATVTGISITSDDGNNTLCPITGNATFNNAAYNKGTVTGNATFNDTSTNRGTVTGNATFTYLTAASGSVTDTTGYANGSVGGSTYDSVGAPITTWAFSTTNNSGTITGNATFSSNKQNKGTVTGNATFSGTATNRGTVTGNATFTYLTAASGLVTDTTGYANGKVGGATYDSVGATITTWVFSTKTNSGTVTGNATFSGRNNAGTVTGDATFSNTSSNGGTVGGNATFSNTAYNQGIVTGNATFNNSASNGLPAAGGVSVIGNATFNNTAYNLGAVAGITTFNDSPDPTMLKFGDVSRVINLGNPANFSFTMFNHAGISCPSCTYTIATNPSVPIISPTKLSNQVTGSFTPTRLGTYSLIVTVSDSADGSSAVWNDLFFVIQPATTITTSQLPRYYLRSSVPTNSAIRGIPGDVGSLTLSQPQSTETRACGSWVQDSLDELPVNYPIQSLLSELDMHVMRDMTGSGNMGVQRFSTYDSDNYDKQEPISGSGTYIPADLTFQNLNWNMNSPSYLYALGIKVTGPNGSGMAWESGPSNLSYVDIGYEYSTTPLVQTTSQTNSAILLLSATVPTSDINDATIVLKNPSSGSTSTNIVLGDTTHHYDRPFSGYTTTISSDGTATLAATDITGITTINSVPLDITPNAGTVSVSAITTATKDSGATYYPSQWTESGAGGAASATHTIGNVKANTYYTLSATGAAATTINGTDCTNGLCFSDPSGQIAFNYTGGYSEHTFNLTEDTTAPTNVSISSITANSATQLTILATTATDSGSGLHTTPYQFEETTGHSGATSSNYQASTTYIDSGLTPNTQYTYEVRARDLAGNVSSYSDTVSKYTLANVPSTPAIVAASDTSLNVTINENSNPSDTLYAIKVGSKYVQVDGTLGDSAIYRTKSTWGTPVTITGLSANTQYAISVNAQNGDGATTDYSSTVSKYNLAPTPANLSNQSTTTNSITLTVDTLPNATADSSGYLFTNSTNTHTSGWITTNTWQDQNLTCGTGYTYTVKYRNGDGTETATTQTTAETSPCPQSQTTSKSVGQGSDPQPNPVANIASSAIKTIQQKFLSIFGHKPNSKDTAYWAPKFISFNFSTTKLIKSMKTELSRATTLVKSFLKVFGSKPNTKQTQSWSNTFAVVKFSVTKLINTMQRDAARIFHPTLVRAHI